MSNSPGSLECLNEISCVTFTEHAIQWESGPDLGTEQKSLEHEFVFMAGTSDMK